MKTRIASLTLTLLIFLGFTSIAIAAEDFISIYLYPNIGYTPQCLEFCKKYGVEKTIMHHSYVAKGEEKPYRENELPVICGWMPWRNFWTIQSSEKTAEQLKAWCVQNIGSEHLDEVNGFEIDEPSWGFGDWKQQSIPELEKDAELRNEYYKKFGCRPTLSTERFKDPNGWRNTLQFRQQLFVDRLSNVIEGYKTAFPNKKLLICLSPTAYESGSQMGVDINLFKEFPVYCQLIIDPYFQAFRRPLQWAGYVIRWKRNAMAERPLGGVLQFYDSHRDTGWPVEGYMDLNPEDVYRQPFEYLMNGASNLTVFVMAAFSQKRAQNVEALGRAFDFARENKHLWQDTHPVSQVGIYFSENTFRMKDMWGPWSRMTGLYGASFQTEYTYYALSRMQVPADIISVPFCQESGLPEKLKGYSVIVLPDVKCMSKYEADSFAGYVKNGGTLIITGETAFYDEYGKPHSNPALLSLTQGKLVSAKEHATLKLSNKSLPRKLRGLSIAADCNDATLFYRMASRHPEWLKAKCKEMKFNGYDLFFSEKLPKPVSAAILPGKGALTLAAYEDGTSAITVNNYGKGKVYYIGPNDVTLFQGEVTDSLEEPVNKISREAQCMELFGTIMQDALGKDRLLEVKTAPAMEVAMRRKAKGGGTLLYFLNHSGRPVQNTKVRVALDKKTRSADLQLYQPGSALQKLSGKIIKAGAGQGIEFEIPTLKIFAAVWIR
ncbi:MAG: beta-galactosidase trimerization domain-containing protein [bacterium]